MPTSTVRQVVVDDNDPLIRYSPGWQEVNSDKIDSKGNSGPTLESTLHRPLKNGTFFGFSFSGTDIYVFGTTGGMGLNYDSWQCTIDGSDIAAVGSLPSSGLPSSMENNSLLCSAQNLTDTSHNLTVTANDFQQAFLFDYLRYTPSDSEDFNDALTFIPFVDPDIIFEGNWAVVDNATITDTKGSSATLSFIGTSVQWFGIISPQFPTSKSQASYSIDGGPDNPLVLNGPHNGQAMQLNQRVFETPVLPFGHHNMTVNFDSVTGSSTPLTLTYFLVQNETSASTISSPSSTIPASVSASPLSTAKKFNLSGVVGGLLGSLLLLCLLLFLFCCHRKRRNLKWMPTVSNPFRHRRPIPRPIERETGSISTLNLFGLSTNPPLPIQGKESLHHEQQPNEARLSVRESQLTSLPDILDENASYYGGYQTWGQAKALEAALGTKQRDSYV